MPLFQLLFIAGGLVAVTVLLHAAGLTGVLKIFGKTNTLPKWNFWSIAWFLIRVAWWLIMIHVIEIAVWALFYVWMGCLPDKESAFYFSGVTYTTVGYGDLVLPFEWRMLGPIEGLAGILMCGLSTGLFFAVVSRLYAVRQQVSNE